MTRKALLIFLLVLLYKLGGTQILITQYYEGASSNKYLEITNLGATPYDLAAAGVYAYLFANARADDPANNTASIGQALSGTIAPLASLLLKNGLAAQPSYAAAAGTGVNFCAFSGDDLVVLSTAADGLTNAGSAWSARIDVVGNGTEWGVDISYYRNAEITSPNPTFSWDEWTAVSLATVNGAAASETAYLGAHGSILPVELVYLNAIAQDQSIAIAFATTEERDNAYFEVEHSSDNGRTFHDLAQVNGQVNSSELHHYKVLDPRPIPGWNFYRLRQVDLDGTERLFGPVGAYFSGAFSSVQLGPIPTHDWVTIKHEPIDQPVIFRLTDAYGRPLQEVHLPAEEVALQLDLSMYPAGRYFLIWEERNRQHQKSLIKY